MRYIFLFSILLFISCKPTETKLTAQQIIDKTIIYAGADVVANSEISFNFRDKKYTALRKNGNFKLFRFFKDKNLGTVSDLVTNAGFERAVDGHPFKVADSMVARYSNAVNSVHYFSVLPFGLNDKAVKKKLLPSITIKGKEYHKIEVTFAEDGGGEDFLIDYLAYSYHTNGGGKRFRVLKEQCLKSGIRFVDFHNYKPNNKDISLLNIDKAFENNNLKKVSEIVLKDIKAKILD